MQSVYPEDAEKLSLYLTQGTGESDWKHTKRTKQEVMAKLSYLLNVYEVYSKVEEEKLIRRVLTVLRPCAEVLREALELEDMDEKGEISFSAFRGALRIEQVDEELLEFMTFFVFRQSEHSERMRYTALLTLLGGPLPSLEEKVEGEEYEDEFEKQSNSSEQQREEDR